MHTIAQNLEPVIIDKPPFRTLHGSLPLTLLLGLLTLSRESTLLGFDGLQLQLAQEVR